MKRLITVTMAFLMLICWTVPVFSDDLQEPIDPRAKYEQLIQELHTVLEEAYAQIDALQDELNNLSAKLEMMEGEYRSEIEYWKNQVELLKVENTEYLKEIESLRAELDKIQNAPLPQYPEWEGYTIEQLKKMLEELPMVIQYRLVEAYNNGMLNNNSENSE